MKEEVNKKIKIVWIQYVAILTVLFILMAALENINEFSSKIFLVTMIIWLIVGFIITMVRMTKLKASCSLQMGFRNIPLKNIDTRAVCSYDDMLNVLISAQNDNINIYILGFMYDGVKYYLGYEKQDNTKFMFINTKTNQEFKFDTIESLKKTVLINHEVTIINEYQADIIISEEGAIIPFSKQLLSIDNSGIVKMDLRDNYLLKDCIVQVDDTKYNSNFPSNM